jgi:hypothetical protein
VYRCFIVIDKMKTGETDEPGEDDKVGNNEFEECVLVPGELKSRNFSEA